MIPYTHLFNPFILLSSLTIIGVPIYLRWTWQDKEAKPIYLDGQQPSGYMNGLPTTKPQPEKIILNNCKCFERVKNARVVYNDIFVLNMVG